jgi:hypothetical protein
MTPGDGGHDQRDAASQPNAERAGRDRSKGVAQPATLDELARRLGGAHQPQGAAPRDIGRQGTGRTGAWGRGVELLTQKESAPPFSTHTYARARRIAFLYMPRVALDPSLAGHTAACDLTYAHRL